MSRTTGVVSLVAILLLLAGCSRSDADRDPGAASWNVTRDALRLEEDLFVTETEDYFFGGIADVAVHRDGRVYVADAGAHNVKVLTPDGQLLETIGREGEGPGEFRRPQTVHLSEGDSLYVMDVQRRITVFAPDTHDLAYTVPLASHAGQFPMRLLAASSDGGGFLMEYGASIRDTTTHGAVLRVSYGGVPQDEVFFALRDPEFLTDESGEIPRSMPKPFRRSSQVAVGPDGHVYHGYTGALSVESYAADGTPLDMLSVPYTPVPVTEEDIAYVKELYSSAWASQMIDRADLDDTKPAFRAFTIDDRGRLWFKRPTADPDTADWWIAEPEGKNVAVVALPTRVDLLTVEGGFAYGRAESEAGAPAVVRYRIVDE